jgi:phytoene desaturase
VRVVVVGAGLGGLAAACHLAGRGYDVTVLERAHQPGGCAAQLVGDGFRIDTGPIVLTMPGILEGTFAAAGTSMDDHVVVRPVDPMYRATFADGSELHVRRGVAAMTEEIRAFSGPRDAAAFERFAAWLTSLTEVELPHFIDRSWDSVLDLAREVPALVRLVRLGALRSMGRQVGRFFTDERLQQTFSFQALYAGLSPFEALAVFCVITYMDSVEGVFAAEGGMHAIAAGLAAAVARAGADVRCDEPVERIERGADGAVNGVRLASGESIAADAVVVNADVAATYRALLEVDAPRVVRRGAYSPSCAVWAAGVRGAPPISAAHHNIHFGATWRASFDALLEDGTRMPDPSILVSLPTVSEAALAPPASSIVYGLEPVPNLDATIAWDVEGPRLRDDLVARIGALGYPVDDVVLEQFTDPADWAARGLERGTPFSLAHRFFQSGPFRPRNVDPRIPGLVLVGMGTVPGVGIPMVLLSGRLAAARVDEVAA